MSDNETYEVSHIVDEDYSNPKQRLFLVRWLGYTSEYDSWEPLKNLIPSAVDVIKEWDRKQKQAQKRKAQENKTNGGQKKARQSSSQTSDESRKESAGRVKTSQTALKENPMAATTLAHVNKVSGQQRSNTTIMSEIQRPQTLHTVQAGTPLYNNKSHGSHVGIVKQENDIPSDDEIDMTSPTLTRRTRQLPKQEPPAHLYTDFFEALDGIDGPPVWVVNDIDSEPCPPLVFKWIEEYHLGAGVPIRDDHFSHGCTCPGKECDLKDPNQCECLDDSEEKKFAYDADGLIHHPPGTAIFECNNQCHCGRTCPNRVVQRGRRMPVEIFKTQKKGWGVRTCRPIPKGMFICQYIGEVITDAEAERRGEEYDRKGITYLFDLDFFRDPNVEPGSPGTSSNAFSVDAMHYGNVSRFFNHSCNPNVAIYTVVRNGDNRVYDLAIFAIRPIKPFEELCFDYKTKKGVKVKQQCFCGERNCRGWLFGS